MEQESINSNELDRLKTENRQLRARVLELEYKLSQLEGKDYAGRRNHDSTWNAKFNVFVELYYAGNGKNYIMEKDNISLRTYYRYKAYLDKLIELMKSDRSDENDEKELTDDEILATYKDYARRDNLGEFSAKDEVKPC